MRFLATRSGGTGVLVALIAITLLGLGLRVGYAVDQPYAPPPDASAYERIAENLAEHGSFDARPAGAAHEVQPSSAYAPGLPLLAGALYEIGGGDNLTAVLILLAVIGSAAIPLTFMLGQRLHNAFCSPGGDKRGLEGVAGLVGAAVVAIYPALLQYQALLLTEPAAATLLVGSLVSLFWAVDRGGASRWTATGALLGLLTLVRPEYLAIAILLPLVCLARDLLRRISRPMRDKTAAPEGWGRLVAPAGISLLATCLVLVPWTVRNAVVLDRVVPVSTGGGKALYIGTYLGAHGDGAQLRELLLDERPALRAELESKGPLDDPDNFALERALTRVAAEQKPGMETDAALGSLGGSHLEFDLSEEPGRFAGMLVDKGYDTWTEPARGVMREPPWRALQLALVLLGLAGLLVLALCRRWLELAACGLVLVYMTAIGALLIASPRRELVVVPLLAALAGVAVTGARDSLARRWAR
jgi:hypothetical protein